MMLLVTLFGLWSAQAFTVVPHARTTTTSALHYTVFGGIDEEETPDQDPHSVGYGSEQQRQQKQQPQQSQNGGVADLSSYRDYDEVLEDEDTLSVDSFSHTSGQAIMPGFHLTALCGDD